MSIDNLKLKILDISKHMNLGERESHDKSYKLFIEHTYETLVTSWHLVHGRNFDNQIYLRENTAYPNSNFEASQVDSKTYKRIVDAVTYYLNMVKNADPFTDFLSVLHEEILLTGRRGEKVGQFMTPPDVSMVLTKLLWAKKDIRSINEIKTIHEPCCGTGSMILAPLARIAKVDSSKIGLMNIIINDLDALMCKVSTVQILSSVLMHGYKFNALLVHNCNLITEWGNENTLMLGIDWQSKPITGLFSALDKIREKVDLPNKVTV
ncbi:N-6 DNA methylase [Pseudomonas parafulva]|uniref:N-6 DNA methylase n=1 Tax=Pseudomonas parafulva TaxID=157782 RepID=UPI003561C2DE